MRDVLNRDKFKRLITTEAINIFLEDLSAKVAWVVPQKPFPTFIDPKDDYLLAMIRDGEADLLVTEDGALLELESFEATEIISPRTFIELLKSDGG